MKYDKEIKEVNHVSEHEIMVEPTVAHGSISGRFEVVEFTQAPLRLVQSVRLKTSQEKIFSTISNPKGWVQLFPWIQSITVDSRQVEFPGNLGACRYCNFGNGMDFVETVVGWNPPDMYAYAVSDELNPFGLKDHLGLILFHTDAEERTVLTWQQYFSHPNLQAMVEKMDSSLTLAMQKLVQRFDGETLETYVNFRT